MKATNKNPNKSFNPQAKNVALLLNRNTRIAEYAYYNSEKRGFEPGHELEDRAGTENLNNAISENLLPFKVREDIRMDQKNDKKSKKKSLTCI